MIVKGYAESLDSAGCSNDGACDVNRGNRSYLTVRLKIIRSLHMPEGYTQLITQMFSALVNV